MLKFLKLVFNILLTVCLSFVKFYGLKGWRFSSKFFNFVIQFIFIEMFSPFLYNSKHKNFQINIYVCISNLQIKLVGG